MINNLKEFYTSIKNPLDDEEVINTLLLACSNNGDFYFYLNSINSYGRGVYNPQEKDNFFMAVFDQLFKNADSSIKTHFKDIHDVSDLQKAFDSLPKTVDNLDLYATVDNLNLYDDHYWIYVNSNELHNDGSYSAIPLAFNVKHRLYVNIDNVDVHKLGRLFFEKCEEGDLPYKFKFTGAVERDDVFVVYSDTEHLLDYYRILTEIKKEHPELEQSISRPPIMSGVVDGWIGYGTEPQQFEQSFNSLRCEIVNQAFNKTLYDLIINHPDLPLVVDGEETTLMDEVASRIVEDEISLLLRYEKNELANYYGLTYSKAKSKSFINNLFSKVRSSLATPISTANGGLRFQDINYKYSDKNSRSIWGGQLKSMLLTIFPEVVDNHPEMKEKLKSDIRLFASKSHIDSQNFAFDTYVLPEFNRTSRHVVPDNAQEPTLDPISKKKYATIVSGDASIGKHSSSPFTYAFYEDENYRDSVMQSVSIPSQSDSESFYQVHQDDDFNNNPNVVGMSDEEIRQAQIQCGFVSDGRYGLTYDDIIQDDAFNNNPDVVGMSDEEILESREKIFTYQRKRG